MADVSNRFCNKIVWLGCYNASGDTIPPYACVMMTGWILPPDISDPTESSPYMLVAQSDGSVSPDNHYINGAVPIPPGSFGSVARPNRNVPLLIALSGAQNDGSDRPYRMVGPSKGSWQAMRDSPAFAMVAMPQQGYVQVVPTSGPYVGQVPGGSGESGGSGSPGGGGLASNSSGPIDVFWASDGKIGDEADTGVGVTAYNRFSSLNAGDWVLFDWSGQGWEVLSGASVSVLRVRLTDTLVRGGSAPAVDMSGNRKTVYEALGINGGTYGAGTFLDVFFNSKSGHWEVLQPLQPIIRGALTDDLAAGGTGTITASDLRTYPVVEVNGSSFNSGDVVEAFFNNWTGRFEILTTSQSEVVVRGKLNAILQKGYSASFTDTKGKNYFVYEVLGINGGSYPSGTNLTAFFNDQTNQWEVLQPLPQVIRGTLQGALTQGGTASITATDNQTYTVHEVLGLNGGQIASGTKVAAFFNNDTGYFEVISSGCSPPR